MVSLKFQQFGLEIKFGEIESLGSSNLLILEGLSINLSFQELGRGTGLGEKGLRPQLELLESRGLFSRAQGRLTSKGAGILRLFRTIQKINREGLLSVIIDPYSEKLRFYSPDRLEQSPKYKVYPSILGEVKITEKLEKGKREVLELALELLEEQEAQRDIELLIKKRDEVEFTLKPRKHFYYNWEKPQYQPAKKVNFPIGVPVANCSLQLSPIPEVPEVVQTPQFRRLQQLIADKRVYYDLVDGSQLNPAHFNLQTPRERVPLTLPSKLRLSNLPLPDWGERLPISELLFCRLEGVVRREVAVMELPIEQKLEELADEGD